MKKFLSLFLGMLLLVSTSFALPFYDIDHGTLQTLGSDFATANPDVIVTGYSQSKLIYDYKSVFLISAVTVTTPAGKTFTCVAATDVCTAASTGFLTGLKGQGTTTTTLPGGLSLSTDYFVRKLGDTTFSLYDTYAHAVDTGSTTGIKDITDTGTGTHTFTPTSIAGGTVQPQGSIDNVNFVDIGSSSNITATANFSWNISDTYYPYVRLKFVNTAGVFTATTTWAGKVRP